MESVIIDIAPMYTKLHHNSWINLNSWQIQEVFRQIYENMCSDFQSFIKAMEELPDYGKLNIGRDMVLHGRSNTGFHTGFNNLIKEIALECFFQARNLGLLRDAGIGGIEYFLTKITPNVIVLSRERIPESIEHYPV